MARLTRLPMAVFLFSIACCAMLYVFKVYDRHGRLVILLSSADSKTVELGDVLTDESRVPVQLDIYNDSLESQNIWIDHKSCNCLTNDDDLGEIRPQTSRVLRLALPIPPEEFGVNAITASLVLRRSDGKSLPLTIKCRVRRTIETNGIDPIRLPLGIEKEVSLTVGVHRSLLSNARGPNCTVDSDGCQVKDIRNIGMSGEYGLFSVQLLLQASMEEGPFPGRLHVNGGASSRALRIPVYYVNMFRPRPEHILLNEKNNYTETVVIRRVDSRPFRIVDVIPHSLFECTYERGAELQSLHTVKIRAPNSSRPPIGRFSIILRTDSNDQTIAEITGFCVPEQLNPSKEHTDE
jgi:hypothetical protein